MNDLTPIEDLSKVFPKHFKKVLRISVVVTYDNDNDHKMLEKVFKWLIGNLNCKESFDLSGLTFLGVPIRVPIRVATNQPYQQCNIVVLRRFNKRKIQVWLRSYFDHNCLIKEQIHVVFAEEFKDKALMMKLEL